MFSFSSEGMKWINNDGFNIPFTFKLGEHSIECLGYQADFISPKVSRLRKVDPTLSIYSIKTNCLIDNSIIRDFKDLLFSKKIELNQSNTYVLINIFIDLENEEFISHFHSYETPTVETVMQMIQIYSSQMKDINPLVSFAAHNFYTLQLPDGVNIEELELILSHKELRLINEDSLLDYFEKLINSNHDYYYPLLRFIQTSSLSQAGAIKYASLLDKITDSSFLASLWPQVRQRFTHPVRNAFLNPRYLRPPSINCSFNGDPFDGIFNHLTKEFHGNIRELGVIHMNASSIFSDSKFLKSLVEENGDWGSQNRKQQQWVQFRFNPRKVSITGYSLRSHSNETWSKSQLRSWILAGSNNDLDWDIIDEQTDVEGFKGSFLKTLTFQTKESAYYSSIRLQRTSQTWGGNYYLALSRVELFGQISIDNSLDDESRESSELSSTI